VENFIDKEAVVDGAAWDGETLETHEQDLYFNYRSLKAVSEGFWSYTLVYGGAKGEVSVGVGLFTQDLSGSICGLKDGLVYNSKPNEKGYITNSMFESPITEEVDALIPGDEIRVEIDNEQGTVTFFRNGIQQGRVWEKLEDQDFYAVMGARGAALTLSLTALLQGEEYARSRPGDWAIVATDVITMGDDVPKPLRQALRSLAHNRARTVGCFYGAAYYPHSFEPEPDPEEEKKKEEEAKAEKDQKLKAFLEKAKRTKKKAAGVLEKKTEKEEKKKMDDDDGDDKKEEIDPDANPWRSFVVLAEKASRSSDVPDATSKLLKYFGDGELAVVAFDPHPDKLDSFCAVSKNDVVKMHNVPKSLAELDVYLG